MSNRTNNQVVETEWHSAHSCTLTRGDGVRVYLEERRYPSRVYVRLSDADGTPCGFMDRPSVTVHDLVKRYGGEVTQ